MNDEPPDPANSDPSQTNEPAQANDGEEYYEPAPKFARAVDYMETEKGHEITRRVVSMLEQLMPQVQLLLNAKITKHQSAPKIDFWKWLALLAVRLVVFAVAIGALIYMRKVGTIDPAIALLIGGLVAYFFGYNKSQS